MANFFKINVVTAAPTGAALLLNGGVASTNDLAISGKLTFPANQIFKYKVYGDIVDAEGAAITAETAQYVELTPEIMELGEVTLDLNLSEGTGAKTINCVVCDDVGNESTVTATITYNKDLPVVTITVEPNRTKISKVAPYDCLTFKFKVSKDVQRIRVMIANSEVDVKATCTQIASTYGSTNVLSDELLAADTEVEVTLYTLDILAASAGDGEKIIKVFAQDSDNTWSA